MLVKDGQKTTSNRLRKIRHFFRFIFGLSRFGKARASLDALVRTIYIPPFASARRMGHPIICGCRKGGPPATLNALVRTIYIPPFAKCAKDGAPGFKSRCRFRFFGCRPRISSPQTLPQALKFYQSLIAVSVQTAAKKRFARGANAHSCDETA